MCPFALSLNCTAAFDARKGVEEHVSYVHPGLKLPCPIVTENGCQRTFKSLKTLGTHIYRHHRSHQQLVCPWAERANCPDTFSLPSEVQAHVTKVHEKRRFPCPFADEPDCDHTFASQGAAREHAKVQHENTRYPCPLAQENNCELVFRTKTAANIYQPEGMEIGFFRASRVHEYNCHKTFSAKQQAKKHSKKHSGIRFPCPQADEHNCLKTFSSESVASYHSQIHSGITFPCPVAEEFGCDSVFLRRRYAQEHVESHTHQFICPRTGCFKEFQSFDDALQHARDPNHGVVALFLCPVLTCRQAVIGKPLVLSKVNRHRELHVSLGHIESKDFVPEPASQLPLHSDLPLYSLILQNGGLSSANGIQHNQSSPGTCNTDSDSDCETSVKDMSNASESDGGIQEDFFPEKNELQESESGMLTEEHRLLILQQNTTIWGGPISSFSLHGLHLINSAGTASNRHCKVNFQHFGYTCRGPTGGTRYMVLDRCPKEVTIDLDTARLRLRGHGSFSKFYLDSRHVGCRVHYRLMLFLRQEGIEPLREPKARTFACLAQGCEQLSFHGYAYCSDHLSYLLLRNHTKPINFVQLEFKQSASFKILRNVKGTGLGLEWCSAVLTSTVRPCPISGPF